MSTTMAEKGPEVINTTPDEISLRELVFKIRDNWRYLKKKWRQVSIAILLGSVLGFTYSLIKKPRYVAKLSFALEDDNSSGGGFGTAMGLASQLGLDLGGGPSSG